MSVTSQKTSIKRGSKIPTRHETGLAKLRFQRKKNYGEKILEQGDLEVLKLTDIISCHSLKHVAAAVASYYVIRWLRAVTIATTEKFCA